MNIQELQEWIKENLIRKDKGLNSSKLNPNKSFIHKEENITHINEIIKQTNFLDHSCDIKQRTYHIYNDILHKIKCQKCKKIETSFVSFKKGYKDYCYECGIRRKGEGWKKKPKKDSSEKLKCKICGKNYKYISNHVRNTHKMSPKEYYDTYWKISEDEEKCKSCGEDTKFYGIRGYGEFCSKKCRIDSTRKEKENNDFKYICEICGEKFKKLKAHLKIQHNFNDKDYYDKFLKKEYEGKCEWCNKDTKFISIEKEYENFCCPSHRGFGLQSKIEKTKLERYGDPKYMNRKQASYTMKNKTKEEKEKIYKKKEKTWLDKYNVDHPMKSETCLNNYHNNLKEKYGDPNYNNQGKNKFTKLERYGDENYNNREKAKQTNLEKHGVEHPVFQLKHYKDLTKQTKLERYGDENYRNSEKAKQTCKNRYGEDNPSKSEIIKNKIKEIKLDKYGVPHHSQVPEIYENIFGSYKNSGHEYTLPSGKIIKIQGYEPQALDILFESYTEEEILHKKSDMPEIWYRWNDNTGHRYYSDFYIPKENLVIEVKSNYTYDRYKNINILKEEATKYLGYNYKLYILEKQ